MRTGGGSKERGINRLGGGGGERKERAGDREEESEILRYGERGRERERERLK